MSDFLNHRRLENNNIIDKAFANDMALVSGSTKGIEIMMKRVNKFMEYNNVIINETKSQYHWNNSKKGPADLRTRGHKLNQKGEGGFFTYLGWTTNMKLDWSVQIQACISKYTPTTKFILGERGITIDQKVQVINTIASTSIFYRTKLMRHKNNVWLEELDKWTLKMLNKRSNSSKDTHAAYWIKYRGWKSLKIESEALYMNHAVNRILNDDKPKSSTKAMTWIRVKKVSKKYGY